MARQDPMEAANESITAQGRWSGVRPQFQWLRYVNPSFTSERSATHPSVHKTLTHYCEKVASGEGISSADDARIRKVLRPFLEGSYLAVDHTRGLVVDEDGPVYDAKARGKEPGAAPAGLTLQPPRMVAIYHSKEKKAALSPTADIVWNFVQFLQYLKEAKHPPAIKKCLRCEAFFPDESQSYSRKFCSNACKTAFNRARRS